MMMPMPTTSTPDSPRPNTDRARTHKDGSIVLSIAEDRICKLNGVGALTWMILEEAETGLTIDQVTRHLRMHFDAINAEGALLYEVSSEQLLADTHTFLNKMRAMNLLTSTLDTRGQEFFRIKEYVCGTTSTAAEAHFSQSTIEGSSSTEEHTKLSKRETLAAFIGLLTFDLLLKFAGFQSLIRRVERWPTAVPRSTDLAICKRVRAMVDRAQIYYPKKAMCLQHSAVVTCLLRRRGIPAQMVLAAQEFPIRVHAWSEVQGYVVNDRQSVKNKHREMRRV
jgi:transglutaminase superfamily protein